MQSTLLNQTGTVFIPISNMERSIAWYSKLLQLPVKEVVHAETMPQSSKRVLCFLTEDLQETYAFLKANNVPILSSGGTFLVFEDPDQNLLMVCEDYQQTKMPSSLEGIPA
jgi:hypothetical protein